MQTAPLRRGGSHLQQAFYVAAEDFRPVLGAERDALRPIGAGLVFDKRVIDREEDAVDADLLNAAKERRVREKPARRHPEMFAESVAEPGGAGAVAHQRHVDAPEVERQALAQMDEDDLQ